MSNLFNFLRSAPGALLFLLMALTAQVPHAATVYARIAPGYDGSNTVVSYVYAIALEGIILVFVLNQWQLVAWLFALVSIAINGCYYYWHTEELKVVAIIARALVSFALPLAIALYSHLVAKHTPVATVPVNASPVAAQSEPQPQQTQLFATAEAEPVVKRYTCADCGQQFAKHQQLNAHQKLHRPK